MLDSERVVQSNGAKNVETNVCPSDAPVTPSLIGIYNLVSIEVKSNVERTYKYRY